MTLARYIDLAHEALDDIWRRGRLPVLAGGSGQYVWALLASVLLVSATVL